MIITIRTVGNMSGAPRNPFEDGYLYDPHGSLAGGMVVILDISVFKRSSPVLGSIIGTAGVAAVM